MGLFPTTTKKVSIALLGVMALLLPFSALPLFGFLGDAGWMVMINRALIYAIAALGLNLLVGVAGQISLGHAFFMAVGAYTAVVLGGEAGRTVWGLGLPIWIWLPAAGVVAALVGILIAPTAVRVRGLYLAFVTLGLVFLGLFPWRHLGQVVCCPTTGRPRPQPHFALLRGRAPCGSLRGGWAQRRPQGGFGGSRAGGRRK